MAWHIVQKLVEGTGSHSTLIGKFWITAFFVIRFLVIVSIAKGTWSGDQSGFKCNTESPGCKQVCFNEFSPISPVRYWFLQLLGVSVMSIMFNVYTTHKLALVNQAIARKRKYEAEKKQKAEERRKALENKTEGHNSNAEAPKEDKKNDEVVATKLTSESPSKLYLAYFCMVLLRLLAEVGFMVGQYYIYSFKFVVPELFQCSHWPCPNSVDCFISRPKEKTIMLCCHYASGCVMIILNIMELIQLSEKIGEAWKTRHQDITKEVFGERAGPQFNMPVGIREWGPGEEGVYEISPSGYPDAAGIPMLAIDQRRARGRRSGLGKRRRRRY